MKVTQVTIQFRSGKTLQTTLANDEKVRIGDSCFRFTDWNKVNYIIPTVSVEMLIERDENR